MATTTDRFGFPIRTCTRCSGKGRILGFSNVHGGICFECKGAGVVHPRGKVALAYSEFATAVRAARECTAAQLVPGDRYRRSGAKDSPYSSPVVSTQIDYTRVTGAMVLPVAIFTHWVVLVTHEDGTTAEVNGNMLLHRVARPVDPAPYVAAATARATRKAKATV